MSERGRARRVVVSNVFSDANIGGAAITAATVRLARRAWPDARITIVRISAREADYALTEAAFPDVRHVVPLAEPRFGPGRGLRTFLRSLFYLVAPWWPGAPDVVVAVRSADVVIGKGGHVFVKRNGLKGVLALWMTAYPLILARRCGIPALTAPTSIGPFEDRLSTVANRWILRRLTHVVARDPRSERDAQDIGLRTPQLRRLPDSVFSMAPPAGDEVDRVRAGAGLGDSTYGVLVVRTQGIEPHHGAAVMDAVEAAARRLLDDGTVTRWLVVPQVSFDHDASVEMARRLGPAASLQEERLRPDQLIALYSGARIVVTCRLHAAIFSFIGGTPAVSVAIDGTKNQGIYETLGLPLSWVTPLDRLGTGALTDACVALGRDQDWSPRILEATGRLHREVGEFAEIVRAAVPGGPGRR